MFFWFGLSSHLLWYWMCLDLLGPTFFLGRVISIFWPSFKLSSILIAIKVSGWWKGLRSIHFNHLMQDHAQHPNPNKVNLALMLIEKSVVQIPNRPKWLNRCFQNFTRLFKNVNQIIRNRIIIHVQPFLRPFIQPYFKSKSTHQFW